MVRGRARLWLPVLFTVTAVLLAGMALGLIAFRLTGGGASLPLTVERTRIGWRVSNPLGERQQICGLAGSRLLWKNGEYLELLDLRSGLATLLQEPSEDGAGLLRGAVSASLSDRQAVWVKLEDDGSRAELLAYDLAAGTREALVRVDSIDQAFAFGGGVVWQQGNDILWKGTPEQRTTTITSGQGIQLADADGSLIEWTQPTGGASSPVEAYVNDLRAGTTVHFGLGVPSSSLIGSPQLAGRALVYQVEDGRRTGSLFVLSLDSGRRTVIAKHAGVYSANLSVVLWNAGAPGHERLWMRPLTGGSKTRVTNAEAIVGGVPLLGDHWSAWTTDLEGSAVQTARLTALGMATTQ